MSQLYNLESLITLLQSHFPRMQVSLSLTKECFILQLSHLPLLITSKSSPQTHLLFSTQVPPYQQCRKECSEISLNITFLKVCRSSILKVSSLRLVIKSLTTLSRSPSMSTYFQFLSLNSGNRLEFIAAFYLSKKLRSGFQEMSSYAKIMSSLIMTQANSESMALISDIQMTPPLTLIPFLMASRAVTAILQPAGLSSLCWLISWWQQVLLSFWKGAFEREEGGMQEGRNSSYLWRWERRVQKWHEFYNKRTQNFSPIMGNGSEWKEVTAAE